MLAILPTLQMLSIRRKYEILFPYIEQIKSPEVRFKVSKVLPRRNKPLGLKNHQAAILIKKHAYQCTISMQYLAESDSES